MATGSDVDAFMAALVHPLKEEIELTRQIIRSARPGITEHLKWKAPSFCFQGEDRVTLKLRPADAVYLIFHRGAKVKSTAGFEFEDTSGLFRWLAPDRAMVTLRGSKELASSRKALRALVARWMAATTTPR